MLTYPIIYPIAFVAGFITFLIQRLELDTTHPTNVASYVGVLGTMFAFMSGFVILLVLTNYSDIRRNMARELNALQDIRDLLIYLDDELPRLRDVEVKVRAYLESILTHDWPRMRGRDAPDTDTPASLYSLMKSVKAIHAKDENDHIALGQIIGAIGQVTSCRTDRLTSACNQMPQVIRNFIVLLAGSLIVGLCIIPFENAYLGTTLNVLLSFVISFIVAIIWDLDTPFDGQWCITPTSYQAMLDREELLCRNPEASRLDTVLEGGELAQ